MDSQYEQSSESNGQQQNQDGFKKPFKRLSKNEQIYGDFYEAYEAQSPVINFSKRQSYGQFKAGSTIETYSSQVQVDLPKVKPKKKPVVQSDEDEQDDQPMLGKFNLNSFLNQVGHKDDLEQIDEEQNQSSKEELKGLNENIIKHLKLVKIGEEIEEELNDIENMNFEKYMKMYKKQKARPEPKYKTEQEKQLAKEFSQGYGVGFKMLQKMGFKVNKGLGKDESGTQRPIQAVFKTAFTMKDQPKSKKQQQSEVEGQQKKQQVQLSIPEQLFQYYSKNNQINDFLLEIKRRYEKANSQIYFMETEIGSINKKHQINLSTKYQAMNQISQLKDQISKLESINQNIQNSELYPHLGQHYKIDLLYAKNTYQKLKNQNLNSLAENAEKQIMKLKSVLYKFYIAKSKQNIRQYEKTAAIDVKMNKRQHYNNKKQSKKQEIIDLDNIDDKQDSLEMTTIGIDEEEKIKNYVSLILRQNIGVLVQSILMKAEGLDKIKNLKVIDLIDLIVKFQQKSEISQVLLKDKVLPLYENYIDKLDLDSYENNQQQSLLPHIVILPWLHLLKKILNFSFQSFLIKISSKIWRIQSNALYDIVFPFLKFISETQHSYFINLVLAPIMLYQFQTFSIKSSNMCLLAGFKKYCILLPHGIVKEIFKQTILMQLHQVYKQMKKSFKQEDVQKWLNRWRKFCDQICKGVFDEFFKDFS